MNTTVQHHPENHKPMTASHGSSINAPHFTSPPAPKSSLELTVIIVLFALLIVSMSINGLDYARSARGDEQVLASSKALKDSQDELAKARTDLKTQIWLRSDSLTKENAELRAHLTAIEDLVQAYGIGRKIPRPKPLIEEER